MFSLQLINKLQQIWHTVSNTSVFSSQHAEKLQYLAFYWQNVTNFSKPIKCCTKFSMLLVVSQLFSATNWQDTSKFGRLLTKLFSNTDWKNYDLTSIISTIRTYCLVIVGTKTRMSISNTFHNSHNPHNSHNAQQRAKEIAILVASRPITSTWIFQWHERLFRCSQVKTCYNYSRSKGKSRALSLALQSPLLHDYCESCNAQGHVTGSPTLHKGQEVYPFPVVCES